MCLALEANAPHYKYARLVMQANHCLHTDLLQTVDFQAI